MIDFDTDLTVARHCARPGAEKSVKSPDAEGALRAELDRATSMAKQDAEQYTYLNVYASISGSLKIALGFALAREEVLAEEVAKLRAQVADLKTELDSEE